MRFGPLPVRPGAIVRAKIASLAIYVCAISAAMHTLASLTYGSLLSIEYFGVGWRGASAHFAAAFAASLFTFLVVTSAQAILALTIAPPYLPRASAALQATLVATILVLLVALPSISRTVSDTLGDARAYRYMFDFRIDAGLTEADRWTARLPSSIAWMPPVWFAGLYETLLRHGLWVAAELAKARHMPIQFHVGYGDRDAIIHLNNPSLLMGFFQEMDRLGVNVTLLHCYPYHREAGYLAEVFPNVYFDVGVILNYTGAMSAHILGEALELSPFTKQLYSSDAFGVAEFYYLGALLYRKALA